MISSSNARDFNPQYSPDGRRIAFVSVRSQGAGIWVADSSGDNAVQVASGTGTLAAPPQWSPDGTQLVFECVLDGNEDICAVPSGGGPTRRITRHQGQDLYPNWSRDGRWIYFTSDRSGSFEIWKLPASGDENQAVQLTHQGGFGAVESLDGSFIYYASARRNGELMRMPVDGGRGTRVGSIRVLGRAQNFAISADGIYYPSSTSPEQWFEIWRFPYTGKPPVRIGRLDKRLASGMTVSSRGDWLLFPAFDDQFGDIYLVENLH
jgi:Tol biopolymer transport system component